MRRVTVAWLLRMTICGWRSRTNHAFLLNRYVSNRDQRDKGLCTLPRKLVSRQVHSMVIQPFLMSRYGTLLRCKFETDSPFRQSITRLVGKSRYRMKPEISPFDVPGFMIRQTIDVHLTIMTITTTTKKPIPTDEKIERKIVKFRMRIRTHHMFLHPRHKSPTSTSLF